MRSIAIFVKNLSSGGAEKQSVLLAKSLAGHFKVYYIIFNGSKVHEKYIRMLQEDYRICIATFRGSHYKRFKQFVNYLKDKKISIIFSYLTAANTYACFASFFCKLKVVTGLRNAKLPILKLLADRLMTNHIAYCTVANSYSGKNYFVSKGFKSKKVIVIPNCFENIKPYKNKIMNPIPHIITVGRFVVQKDYETAIKAVSKVKETGKTFRFDIVGYGEKEHDIRDWIRQYDIENITSIYINPGNIAELLDKADIYLSTSLFEGTSNSIMEALNADLPVVCTNVGDNNCLVEDKETGFLSKVKDFEGIAENINILLDNCHLRRRMGYKAKKRLENNYSVERFRSSYTNLIERRF